MLEQATEYRDSDDVNHISISHFVETLRKYSGAITMSILAVFVTYLLGASLTLVLAPAQRITKLPFRLDFEGAATGRYPNGLKFSSADIVATPILLTVYRNDHIERYATFPAFSRSLFVIETNRAYERLASDYGARLNDPKLSPVDRDRVQREFEAKLASINKDEYSIEYLSSRDTAKLPPQIINKVLRDTMNIWAEHATIEQRVLQYRVPVLSPDVMQSDRAEEDDPIVAVQMIRSKLYRVLANLAKIRELPGAELIRTTKEGTSLDEIRIRIEEIIRFRLEPLVGMIASRGMLPNRVRTLRLLESQLAYDQRQLGAAQQAENSVRDALAAWERQEVAAPIATTSTATAATRSARPPVGGGDMVMPQLSDSFIEQIINLTNRDAENRYREKLVDDLREASTNVIPLQMAVEYDNQILRELRNSPPSPGQSRDAASVVAEMASIQTEARDLIRRMNEIYLLTSRNLNPSTHLFTILGVPTSQTIRAVSVGQLGLIGAVIMLIAVPTIVIFSLLHNRVREEEEGGEPQRRTVAG